MATYNYTNGDGVTALSASTPDGASEPVSVLDDAIRQVKAYLLDPTKGPNALITALNSGKVGFIEMYGGSSAPTGYLLCDGAAVSRTTYSALFAIIGVAFGPGDSVTTFNVPDIRGRTAFGVGTSSEAYAPTVALGQKFGAGGAMMTLDMLVAHTHTTTTKSAFYGTAGANPIWANEVGSTTGSTGNGAAPILSIPPTQGVNYIIKF